MREYSGTEENLSGAPDGPETRRELYTETPWAPSWPEITFLSAPQRTASAVTQVLFGSTRPGGRPWPPSADRVSNTGSALRPCLGHENKAKQRVKDGTRGKVRGLVLRPARETHSFTLDSQLLVPKMILGGLHLPRPEVGSQFPNQGLKPGCGNESTEASPLDQEGRVASFKTLGHQL